MPYSTIDSCLAKDAADAVEIKDILQKAETCVGLTMDEVGRLLTISTPALDELLFTSASRVKKFLYGNRVVLFAPLYISNYCTNKCLYCGFRCDNRDLDRKKLTMSEIAEQTKVLINMGHKRLLLETGEDRRSAPIEYVLNSIHTIYNASVGNNAIRRVNVNIAATTSEEYRLLKEAGIGTYQLFQETYHPKTYKNMHVSGPKSDYEYHFGAMERALEGGIDDFGMGVLYGLYDHRFETMALVAHARLLKSSYGVGPHTVSVPRLRPAQGASFFTQHLVNDEQFKRLVAILRLALPYTGIILSTRESVEMRRFLLKVGVSQMSAASATSPGGYSEEPQEENTQFEVDDHSSLDECVASIMSEGYIPSFCTGCYRKGRTGEQFMDMVEHGHIKELCHPNAILTLAEYLQDFASDETRALASRNMPVWIKQITDDSLRTNVAGKVERILRGERDIYV